LIRRLHVPLVLWRRTRDDGLTTIALRQPALAVAALMLLGLYVAAPTAVTVMLLVAVCGLLAVAFMWARAMALGVAGRRRLRYAAVQVGDELEEGLTLYNATDLPVLWAEFVDRSNLPGYTVASVRAADGRSTIRWKANTICSRRGVFSFGPWELRLSDPFGIFLVRHSYTHSQELVVYPQLAVLPGDLFRHSTSLGDYRPLRQPLQAETISAISARPYQPGDPLRHMHWRTTARRGAPFAKVFMPEASSTVWLIPDFDPAVHLGEGDDSTEETMVLLAAPLANQFLRLRLRVGLLAYAESGRPSVVAPQAGQAHLWQILRALAPLRPNPTSGSSLAQTLERARTLVSSRDLAVVITPSVSADWPRQLKRLARHSSGGGAEAILLDPASFGGAARAEACRALLAELGLGARVVQRGEIRPVASSYGALRRWEFIALGTGRAVARQTPRSAQALASP
jgi:uncharacterized protein (DUF58 family)